MIFINQLIAFFVRGLLRLRYRVKITGLDKIKKGSAEGIILLPNHPALIDPVILSAWLYPVFRHRPLGDAKQVDRPLIRNLASMIGVITLPDISELGKNCVSEINQKISLCADVLKKGGCILFYPGGRLMRGRYEDMGGNSALQSMLQSAPGCRVILIRTTGLWGSGFSRSSGEPPFAARVLWKGFLSLMISGIFFAPRRKVMIEICEPDDFPFSKGKIEQNRYLEAFYNEKSRANTYVPYSIFEKGAEQILPEPEKHQISSDISEVPGDTVRSVCEKIRELTGISAEPQSRLSSDLGMDSLMRVELAAFIEKEYGFPQGNPDSLETVMDCCLAACGKSVSARAKEISPPPADFMHSEDCGCIDVNRFKTLGEAFLFRFKKSRGTAVWDNSTGGLSMKKIKTAMHLIMPHIDNISDNTVGIMLPSSCAALISFFSVLFSGKTPVMINWTVGRRNLFSALKNTGTEHILTSRKLLDKLDAQGNNLHDLPGLLFLEDIFSGYSRLQKLAAFLKGCFSFGLDLEKQPETAVVLFTSGSENTPKAVPLTHENLLTNVSDVLKMIPIDKNERLLSMLPPFHSFGLTGTMLLPLFSGMKICFHPNPTEAVDLSGIIQKFRITILPGTPTFVQGILRASKRFDFNSLRLIITGAEKCPDKLFTELSKKCPEAVLLEGYGITECSPVVSINSPGETVPGSIGKILPSVSYLIVNPETMSFSATEKTGLLLVRGKSIFRGYLNHTGKSPFISADGHEWYNTGDIVSEKEGILFFSGRLKRFIKIGGEMVSLPAVESVLLERFQPADSETVLAVIEGGTEENPEILLCTTLKLDRESVNTAVRESGLSGLHSVRRVIEVSEIPLLGSGKTDYRKLREVVRDKW